MSNCDSSKDVADAVTVTVTAASEESGNEQELLQQLLHFGSAATKDSGTAPAARKNEKSKEAGGARAAGAEAVAPQQKQKQKQKTLQETPLPGHHRFAAMDGALHSRHRWVVRQLLTTHEPQASPNSNGSTVAAGRQAAAAATRKRGNASKINSGSNDEGDFDVISDLEARIQGSASSAAASAAQGGTGGHLTAFEQQMLRHEQEQEQQESSSARQTANA